MKRTLAILFVVTLGCASSRVGHWSQDFINVAEKVRPATVYVEVILNGMPGGPPAGFKTSGSGFIFDSRGYVLTNYHVVGNAKFITVTTLDNMVYEAELWCANPKKDIAILKIKSHKKKVFPTVKLGNSDKIKHGQWVMAVGSPLGMKDTVSVGVISSVNPDGFPDYFQMDVVLNPGSSGGPLYNLRGEVIGITSAFLSPSGAYSGVTFSIPINDAKELLKKNGIKW